MVYHFVPIERVMAKITRDTMLTEGAWTAFMPEWIAEVVRNAAGTRQHVFMHKDGKLCYHKLKLPCNIRILDGVSYNGCRLRHRDIESAVFPTYSEQQNSALDTRYSIPTKTETITQDEDGNVLSIETSSPTMYWNDLVRLRDYGSGAWYAVEPGYLICSLKDADIRLHFRALPHDDRGFVLIPDNQKLLDAIAYYVRAMMIGTGRRDPVYQLDDRIPMQRYVLALDDAKSEMAHMTPDMFASMGDVTTRGYPPEGYHESFSTYISPETYHL